MNNINQSSHGLDDFLKKISLGLLLIDKKGQIVLFNIQATELLGQKELLGQFFWDLLDDQYFGFSMREALKTGAKKTLSKAFTVYTSYREDEGLLLLFEKKEHPNGLAHDIGNALAVIIGFATLLQKNPTLDEKGQKMVEHILTSSQDLNLLMQSKN